MSQKNEQTFPPFAVLTSRLILLPTPIAISISNYRILYATLHADPAFCEMAFSHHFPAVTWSDEQTYEVIHTRDVQRCWGQRGLGDFAVGLLPEVFQQSQSKPGVGRELGRPDSSLRVLEQDDYSRVFASSGWELDSITWIGYAGVRDATATSMPDRTATDHSLPSWLEMIELRYGVASGCWGKGIAKEAAEAVMEWARSERGVKRFIAETEKANARSGKVLEKMGFRMSGTEYWKDPEEIEWERPVA
ncbi:hypothetical protein K491DRAFT_599634 [Lophiostoma macrostomum CBS 122681]|uniref:N-acetyltransferase domain-containing protein n=1 Tax=Lophiostoma macrostomum CBS 122681 TaxID=1314788 RepID=A0A6A6T7V8_9PLEO|nr:hypothetical protein K491DRAFT_599634 [Lophiostoma macrostomum CBS 122681]